MDECGMLSLERLVVLALIGAYCCEMHDPKNGCYFDTFLKIR